MSRFSWNAVTRVAASCCVRSPWTTPGAPTSPANRHSCRWPTNSFITSPARACAEHNVQPGQPLRYWIETEEELPDLSLQPPGGEARKVSLDDANSSDGYPIQVRRLPRGTFVEYEATRETGVYRVFSGERTIYYVAQPDARESDLTPCDENDRAKVAKFLDVNYENDREQMFARIHESAPRKEVWSLCLLGVVALLCGEVWMTRRLVKSQS